ncbi:hypothetical protein M431DRAFT_415456 [Trichoderma harzianum CBS 226.95]|uniref:Uncharacterized protein n=1 Tax=Trichoderma harzianum CBS 226.95 TaxID=983964 RepID=A0A2T4AGG7_TRIHA|nr:hypothetical protein M431DRAFT_415456 [Trichoderma harzianum CBS 226.95]PTB56008.1 hypothetical protein M431DRAFT_415456 [Trichoderma harzianum CBS 226.95]
MSRTVASLWLFASVFQASVSTPPSKCHSTSISSSHEWAGQGLVSSWLGPCCSTDLEDGQCTSTMPWSKVFPASSNRGDDNEYPAGAQC